MYHIKFLIISTLIISFLKVNAYTQVYTTNNNSTNMGAYKNTDTNPPTIFFSPLNNSNASNRTLTNFATITDDQGISSTSKPRLYYKKSTDANVFGGNTSSDNGWKYVIASNSTSPYSFTINHSILWGGTVSNGTTIEYFIVAQDESNNFSSYPEGATASANPPVANINAKPSTVYTYNIYTSTIGGTINVGTGQTYTSLTGAGGVFEAINTKIVNQNIVINITSDLTEDGSNSLNELSGITTSYYYVTIKSNNSTMKTISGTNVPDGVPMININGADNLRIDGRIGFSGPFLTFINTKTNSNTTGPVIQFTNGSEDSYISKIIVESNSNSSSIGSINIGNNGYNSIEISESKIRDAQAVTSEKPKIGIYSNSSNNFINIYGNEISNFNAFGILLNNVADGCTIAGNSFFSTDTSSANLTSISVQNGNLHTISNNFIGGSSSEAEGLWLTRGSGTFKGISTSGSVYVENSIQNNNIRGIELTGEDKSNFIGIEVTSGKASIGTEYGNYIGHSILTILNSGDSTTTGILVSSDDEIIIDNNIITNLYAEGPGSNVSLKGIHYCGKGSPKISGNYIFELSSSGSSMDSSSSIAVCGILSNNQSLKTSITANEIYNLNSIHSSASTLCMGIAYSTTNDSDHYVSNNTIAKNKIYGLRNSSSNTQAGIYGIYLFKGNNVYNIYPSISKVYNNMISLSNDANTNGIQMKGIYSNIMNQDIDSIHYNSIKITGNSNANANTFCIEKKGNSRLVLQNNILVNERSGLGGKHYSLGITYPNPSTNWNGSNVNYNLFYTSNPTTTNYWSGDKTFNDFKTISNSNANSSNVNVFFEDESVADLHLSGSSKNDINLVGTSISSIIDDYDGDTRPLSPYSPYMGADEVATNPLPITLLSFSGTPTANSNLLSWTTATELNSNYFEVQRLTNKKEFEAIAKLKANVMSKELNTYQFEDKTYNKAEPIAYYRLKIVDLNNVFEYSDLIAVKRNKQASANISLFPNPSTDIINVLISQTDETKVELKIIDIRGKIVYQNNQLKSNNIFSIPIENLAPGIYTIQTIILNEIVNEKFIKK